MNRFQMFMARVRSRKNGGDGREVLPPREPSKPGKVIDDGRQVLPGMTPSDRNPATPFDRPSTLGLGRRVEQSYSSRPFGVARDDSLF